MNIWGIQTPGLGLGLPAFRIF